MIAAVIIGIACLVLTGCSELGASTGVGAPEVPVNEGAGVKPKPTASHSDSGSPGTNPAKQNPGAGDRSSSPAAIKLAALDQPTERFADPKLPPKPKDDAAELERLEYELDLVAWKSAGVVDKKAKEDCDISEAKLIKVGSYNFGCTITTSGVNVSFKVRAKVTKSKLDWSWRAPWLPVSEEKAVYEATRQAFRPARVTCDIVGVELVRVDKRDGLTCWVTDTQNKRTTYHGELVLAEEKGEMKFLLVFKPA